MKKRHGSVICRGAFCDGMGCILLHPQSGWFPSFCGKRQGVAAKPPPVTISCPPDTRRWTEAVCPLSDRPLLPPLMNLYRFQRWQVAAALSAAVTTPKPIGDRPHSQAEPTMLKSTRQTPAALRERGSGGEALLSEKRPLPQNLPPPPPSLRGGSAREGSFSTEKLPSLAIPFTLYFFH